MVKSIKIAIEEIPFYCYSFFDKEDAQDMVEICYLYFNNEVIPIGWSNELKLPNSRKSANLVDFAKALKDYFDTGKALISWEDIVKFHKENQFKNLNNKSTT